ncbi:dihydrofolate reductase [Rubritalea tangerina]|uniref:Dihydrofolate reductase n=1 Tax=Rubritalea tangerina TaxID=430798 RepID=A0ABW4ZE62_9BACT
MPEQISLTAMVAMTPSRVIGKGNDLPWHLPEDLKLFKKTTSGHPIVMGRKTFESIGRALPKRQNIVITRDKAWSAEGVDVIHSPDALEEMELMDSEVFIIGGAEIYGLFLPKVDALLVSHVYQEYDGDTRFPAFERYFSGYEVLEVFDEFELRKYS